MKIKKNKDFERFPIKIVNWKIEKVRIIVASNLSKLTSMGVTVEIIGVGAHIEF